MKIRGIALLAAIASTWYSVIHGDLTLFSFCIGLCAALLVGADGKKTYSKLRAASKHAMCLAAAISRRDLVRVSSGTNDKTVQITRPFLRGRMMAKIQNMIALDLQKRIGASGKAYNPALLAQQSLSYTVLSFLAASPTLFIFGIYVGPAALALLPLPLLWILYPRIRMIFDASERRAAVSDEVAFFTLYAGIMQSVGQSFYQSMVDIVGKGAFPAFENEARLIIRNVRLFGFDYLSALNEHALSHPSPVLRSLLLGYVSISTSGGDLGRYLETKNQEILQKTQFKHHAYRVQAHMIGESILILLTILPTMLMVCSFLLEEDSLRAVMGISFVLVPAMTACIIAATNLSQPKTHNDVSFDAKCIGVGAASSGMLLVLGQPLWAVLGAGVFAGAAYNMIACFRQFREISLAESALADFLRDVTEYQKIGIPVQNAIIKISEGRRYNVYFDNIVAQISAGLRYGNDLSGMVELVRIRSGFAKMAFFILGQIAKSGGGSAQILEQLTCFVSDVYRTGKDTKSSIGVICYFAMASPILMSYTSAEMSRILQKLDSGADEMTRAILNMQSVAASYGMLEMSNTLIIISGISLGLVVSKLAFFTVKYTAVLAAYVAVSMLSIFLSPVLPSFIRM